MSFERPITIKEAIDNIHKNKYLLPAIQREFVWETDKIELLFDSLMRGYPIGSFLFWNVERDNLRNYQFYEFIREYHERDNPHNLKADISGDANITSIFKTRDSDCFINALLRTIFLRQESPMRN